MSSNEEGFSLVELLIVVAIMGIIMGITIPSISFIDRQKVKTALDINVTKLQQTIAKAQIKGGESFYFNEDEACVENGINKGELETVTNCFVVIHYGDHVANPDRCLHLIGEKHTEACLGIETIGGIAPRNKTKIMQVKSNGRLLDWNDRPVQSLEISMGKDKMVYSATINGLTGTSKIGEVK